MQGFCLNPSACIVYVCRVCILPPSLHSTPCMRFTLTSVCSLYFFARSAVCTVYIKESDYFCCLFIFAKPNLTGTSCFPQTPWPRVFHRPRHSVTASPRTPAPYYPLSPEKARGKGHTGYFRDSVPKRSYVTFPW